MLPLNLPCLPFPCIASCIAHTHTHKQMIEIARKKRKWNETETNYPEPREASSLAQSCHIAGLNGNNSLMASLAFLSFSMSPFFLRALMYWNKNKKTPHQINTHTPKKKNTTNTNNNGLREQGKKVYTYLDVSVVVGRVIGELDF